MNPLTQIKNTQKATFSEVSRGVSDSASWHARFRHSAYVFTGGLSYELTDGDVLAVFSQYGEIVDVNLVRDKETLKSKGFAFVAYEDQRSTVLAVDNLSGSRVAGRVIRVEHVDNYRKKKAEMEGEEYHSSSSEEEADESESEGEEAPMDRTARAAAVAAGIGAEDEPWMKAGSIFDIMNAAPSTTRDAKKEKKAKKAKKKEKKKDKKKEKKEMKKEKREAERFKAAGADLPPPPTPAGRGGPIGPVRPPPSTHHRDEINARDLDNRSQQPSESGGRSSRDDARRRYHSPDRSRRPSPGRNGSRRLSPDRHRDGHRDGDSDRRDTRDNYDRRRHRSRDRGGRQLSRSRSPTRR